MRNYIFVFIALFLIACAPTPRDDFTLEQRLSAQPDGFDGVRLSSAQDLDNPAIKTDRLKSDSTNATGVNILALSGGGANGAFGAGVLVGWTQRGDRPPFQLVTGVSTGALIAPFAFLGSAYDDKLRTAYINGAAAKLLTRNILPRLFIEGVYSGEKLKALVDTYVDADMVADIAKAHTKGRRLIVATTDLDLQKSILWNLGAIAQQGMERGTPQARQQALQLIRQVLVASASLPGAFAPVLIETQTDFAGISRTFREMHADGSISLPFFVLPESLPKALMSLRRPEGQKTKSHIYILINGNINPRFDITKNTTLSVAARSLDTLTRAQARTTLATIKTFADVNGFEVKVMAMPDDYGSGGILAFDKLSMQKLFAYGLSLGQSPKAFKSAP
jgi:hypothetical protein